MTKEEISKIKEHIEIHARLEPRAVHITEIMRRAVGELEHIAELERENEELKGNLELYESGGCRATKVFECGVVKELKEQLTKKADTNHSLVEQMSDLESKNAELVKTAETFQATAYKSSVLLTKAKEIIKKLARVTYADFTDGDYSNELSKVLEQAEQLLQEIEK